MSPIKTILCNMGSKWSAYTEDVTAYLRERFDAGDESCEFQMQFHESRSVHKYLIDFSRHTQTNVNSGKVRMLKILRHGEHFDMQGVVVMKGHLIPNPNLKQAGQNKQVRPRARDPRETAIPYSDAPLCIPNPTHRLRCAPPVTKPTKSTCAKTRDMTLQLDNLDKPVTKPTKSTVSAKTRDMTLQQLAAKEEQRLKNEQIELDLRRKHETPLPTKYLPDANDVDFFLVYNSVKASDAIRLALIHLKLPFLEEFVPRGVYRGFTVRGALCILNRGMIIRSREAVLRYLGVRHHLYPTSLHDQAVTDELIEDCRVVGAQLIKKMSQREVMEIVAAFMVKPEQLLKAHARPNGTSGIFGKRNIADFELAATTRLIAAHDLVEDEQLRIAFPHVMALKDKIINDPKVVGYLEARRREEHATKLRRIEKKLPARR